MKKEQYQSEIKRLQDGIRAFQAAINLTNEQYIRENKRFNIGEKVKVIDPAYVRFGKHFPENIRFAFVKGFQVSYFGEIETILFKCKKDGTPSRQRDYTSENKIHPL